MIGKFILGGLGIVAGASLSKETKDSLRAAARGVRDDLGNATKDVRARASKEWDRVRQFVREEILEEEILKKDPPCEPPASPDAPGPDSQVC